MESGEISCQEVDVYTHVELVRRHAAVQSQHQGGEESWLKGTLNGPWLAAGSNLQTAHDWNVLAHLSVRFQRLCVSQESHQTKGLHESRLAPVALLTMLAG